MSRRLHSVGPMAERQRIVGMLRNLLLYFGLGPGGAHFHSDDSSDLRESLLCEFASLQTALPLLPPEERRVISLVGLQGLSEREAGQLLHITQKAVNKRLWSAARRVQELWKEEDEGSMPAGRDGSGIRPSGSGASTRSSGHAARSTRSGATALFGRRAG